MTPQYTILIVDDEKNQRQLLGDFVQDLGYRPCLAESVAESLAMLDNDTIDLVLSDFKLGDGTGEEILDHIQAHNPLVQFILFTAYGTVHRAVEVMKKGAADYLSKPLDLEELEIKISKILKQKTILEENLEMRRDLEARREFSPILFKSRAMEETINLALRGAQSAATILVTGESGTGKEILSRAIHQASPRAKGSFVAVNCSALNENLLESELFGHERGAFTGAERRRIGRFEEAHGGTLFLDEIGDLPLPLQVKLLRVLQERVIQRIGSNQDIRVDFRLIAATHRNLQELVTAGQFRHDLFYRLNVIRLNIPPLRERKEDIPVLVDHFIQRFAAKNNREISGIGTEALHLLVRHDFPGNVRELENLIERAVVLTRTTQLHPEDFPDLQTAPNRDRMSGLWDDPLPQAVESLERLRIEQALEASDYIQTRAAELLGINERNLRYKMEKFGMPSRRKK